jgi:hypothetical protein
MGASAATSMKPADRPLTERERDQVAKLLAMDDEAFAGAVRRYMRDFEVQELRGSRRIFRSPDLLPRTLATMAELRAPIAEQIRQMGSPRNRQDKEHRRRLEQMAGRMKKEMEVLRGIQKAAAAEEGLQRRAALVVADLHRDEHALARRLLDDFDLSIEQAIVAIRKVLLDGWDRQAAAEYAHTYGPQPPRQDG